MKTKKCILVMLLTLLAACGKETVKIDSGQKITIPPQDIFTMKDPTQVDFDKATAEITDENVDDMLNIFLAYARAGLVMEHEFDFVPSSCITLDEDGFTHIDWDCVVAVPNLLECASITGSTAYKLEPSPLRLQARHEDFSMDCGVGPALLDAHFEIDFSLSNEPGATAKVCALIEGNLDDQMIKGNGCELQDAGSGPDVTAVFDFQDQQYLISDVVVEDLECKQVRFEVRDMHGAKSIVCDVAHDIDGGCASSVQNAPDTSSADRYDILQVSSCTIQ